MHDPRLKFRRNIVRTLVLLLAVLVGIVLLSWLMDLPVTPPGVTMIVEPEAGTAVTPLTVSSPQEREQEATRLAHVGESRMRVFMQDEGFASLAGRVVSAESKEAIAGSQIEVLRSVAGILNLNPGQRNSVATETDQAGYFLCSGLEEMSSVTLRVRADGYLATDFSQLQLGNGKMDLGDVKLRELRSRVRVHVSAAKGKSLQGVKIRAIKTKGDSMESVVTMNRSSSRGIHPLWETNQMGMVSVPLAPGFYRFEIMPSEYVPTVSDTVEVRRGRESKLSVILKRGKPLRVLVEDRQGLPISGVWVGVSWGDNRWSCNRTTLENGVAEFSSIPLGTPLRIETISRYSANRTLQLESHPGSVFRIVLSDARAWIRLEVEPMADKRPLSVSLARSDRDGTYQVSRHRFKNSEGIHRIPVAVGADSNGIVRYRLFVQSDKSYMRSRWLILEPGKTRTCRLSLGEGSKGSLMVRVVSDSNEAIPNALVQVRIRRRSDVWPTQDVPPLLSSMIEAVRGYHAGSYDSLGSWRTNSRGEALIHVLPGAPLKVTVSHPDHGQAVRAMDACLPGAHRRLAVVLDEKGSIHGKVYCSGKMLAGTYVCLEEEDGLVRLSTPVADNGTYRFDGIPDGDYRLVARTAAWRSADRIDQSLALWSSQAVSKSRLSLVPMASLTRVASGNSVRVDLHLRDQLGDQLRSVRFEVMGLPQGSVFVLEVFPLDQKMSGAVGSVAHKLQLSRDGTGAFLLRKGTYFLRVSEVGKANTLMGWKRIHVLADSSSSQQIVKIWSHQSNLTLHGLSTFVDGIVGLRLIPEAGFGSANRRFSWTVKDSPGDIIRVAGVPHGVYRVEVIPKSGGKAVAMPGTVRVHGRECVKRY